MSTKIETNGISAQITESGIIEVTVKPPQHSIETAIESIATIKKLANGKKYPFLLNISHGKNPTIEARRYYSSESSLSFTNKIAILTDSIVTNILAKTAGLLFANSSRVKAKVFLNHKDAEKWLLANNQEHSNQDENTDFVHKLIGNEQLAMALDVITKFAANDFTQKVTITGKNDVNDALATAINMLGEELEYSRKKEQEALAQTCKLSSLGQMTATMAHEINNPVGVIFGRTGILLKHIENGTLTNEILKSNLEKIKNTSNRISVIVKSLRNHVRPSEKDPFELVSVKSIIDETVNLCFDKFEINSVKLNINEVPDVKLECRPTQISQVLINLLNNAFDAINDENEKWINIDVKTTGDDNVIINVTDSGGGLSSDLAEKIMQPYFTTKESGKGTGLGLSISKKIIEDHGGKLKLDLEHPNTRFYFELPLSRTNEKKSVA